MSLPYIPTELIVIIIIFYFAISYLYPEMVGGYYVDKVKKIADHKEAYERMFPDLPNRKLTLQDIYFIISLYLILPFVTLTKNNERYSIRLTGYLLNFLYGGIGYVLHVIFIVVWALLFIPTSIVKKLKSI